MPGNITSQTGSLKKQSSAEQQSSTEVLFRKSCSNLACPVSTRLLVVLERRRGPVVGHSLWTRPARVQSPWEARIIRCKNLALYIRDCESLCLSDETVKAVGPFYLVSMPGEVRPHTGGKCVTCRGLHIL